MHNIREDTCCVDVSTSVQLKIFSRLTQGDSDTDGFSCEAMRGDSSSMVTEGGSSSAARGGDSSITGMDDGFRMLLP